MTVAPVIETARTILRPHTHADFEPFAKMWADPVVTEHFGRTFDRGESWTRFLRSVGLWPILGFGYWAVEDRVSGAYLGLVGIADFERGIPEIAGVPEAGWVLGAAAHGRGIATETVAAMMRWADGTIDAPRTCCIIDPSNTGSFNVADKMGYVRGATVPFDGKNTVVLWRERHAAIRMSAQHSSVSSA